MMLQNFLDYLKLERNYSGHTITAYQNDLSAFQNFCKTEFEVTSLNEVGYPIIRSWILSLTKKGMSNLSINRKVSSLKSFYKFLQKIGEIETNPLVGHKALKVQKKIQVPFSKKEILEVMDSIQGDDFESVRNRLLIEILYATGIRRTELINIKVSDIDFSDNVIRILGKRNKERFVPILSTMLTSIHNYLLMRNELSENDYLFVTSKGNKIYESLVYRIINSYFSLASTKLKRSPHILRHSFATHLLNEGANLNSVKELLGHSSLASTQVYTKNSLESLKQMYNQAHPRSNKK
ncbi:MAG: tyrosine-type recombinase/integrase [Polaribacter sp.]